MQTRATSRPARCGISIRHWSARRGLKAFVYQFVGPTEEAPAHHFELLVGDDPMGAAGRTSCRDLSRHRGGHRLLPLLGHQASSARIRHRRRRRQACRPRAARAPRQHGQVSAVGDGLQVPRAAAAHEAAADRGERRAARARIRLTPCSSPSSWPVRRCRWRRCTTPRTSRARTCAKGTPSSSRRLAT